jgi:hypothetical protein
MENRAGERAGGRVGGRMCTGKGFHEAMMGWGAAVALNQPVGGSRPSRRPSGSRFGRVIVG